MPVKIDKIMAQRLGPIASLELELGPLNLIYGQNEQGKTHLVEFIIRSLFSSARKWDLRDSDASGKVWISGLEDNALVFSPKGKERLDDFWDQGLGLPEDFSRLLVVKGAELAIAADARGGISRSHIKHFLSGRQILERIENRIPKTVQESRLLSSEISGSRRGEIKDRETLKERLATLEQLFVQVNKRYSGGRRQMLENELNDIQNRISEQRLAQRHTAWKLQQDIDALEDKRQQLSREVLQQARDTLNLHRQKIRESESRRQDLAQSRYNSRHHEWLINAVDIYESMMHKAPEKVGWLCPVLAGVTAVGTAVAAFFGIWQASAAGVLLMGVLGWLISRRYRALLANRGQALEMEKLAAAFEDRFGEPLTGLPQLREKIVHCQEDYSKASLLEEQLANDNRNIEQYEVRLDQLCFQLSGHKVPAEQWESLLLQTGKELETLENQLQQKRVALAQLNTDPEHYISEPVSISYNRQELLSGVEEESRLRQAISETDVQLEDLKRSIFQEVNDRSVRNWSELLTALRDKLDEAADAYKEKTAAIIGKKLVHKVIQSLEEGEDEKLRDALDHELVKAPLHTLTGRYTDMALEGQNLTVSDGFNSFDLSELSSGAREQVLLALRMGFAARLAHDEPLFLILDDAFQYSDWKRRQRLVGEVVRLVQAGWQVIYFTMDNHIRDLFIAAAQPLGSDFKLIRLGEDA